MTTWKEASEDLKARVESNFKVHARRYFEAFEEDPENNQSTTEQYNQAWTDFMDLCAEESRIDIDITRHVDTLNFKLTNTFPVLQNLLNTQPLFTINYTIDYKQNDFQEWLENTEIEDQGQSFKIWALGELSDAFTRGVQDLVSKNLQISQVDEFSKFWEELINLYIVFGHFMDRLAGKIFGSGFENKAEEELEPVEEIPEETSDLISSVEAPEANDSLEESQKLNEAYWDVSKTIYKAFEKLMKLEDVKRYCVSTERIEPDWAGSDLSFDILWDSDEVPEQEVKDYLKAKFPYIKFSNSWDKAFEHVIGINVPKSVWSK